MPTDPGLRNAVAQLVRRGIGLVIAQAFPEPFFLSRRFPGILLAMPAARNISNLVPVGVRPSPRCSEPS